MANKARKTLKTLDFPCYCKNLELQPTSEYLCSEAGFLCISIWPCSAVTFLIPVTQWNKIYEVSGGKIVYCVLCGKQPCFPTTEMTIPCKSQNGMEFQ